MLDLLFSVLSSACIFIAFKLFPKYKVYTLYGIIVNYATAASLGLLFYFQEEQAVWPESMPWIWGCLVLGVLFIVIFNLMARTAQEIGVGIASVATKMSLVIPVLFGLIFLKETVSTMQIGGIVLALAAVYMITAPGSTKQSVSSKTLWLPLLIFLGSGVIDTSINFIREGYLTDTLFPLFSCLVFAVAAVSGIVFSGLQRGHLPRPRLRDLAGGIALGIPNYFSIYFLLRALNRDDWGSATIFTLNNVAIVVLTTLIGILLFKERLRLMQSLGILLALTSIVLLAL